MSVHLLPWNTSLNLLDEANRLYDAAGTFNCIEQGDLVAVKVHVGEIGNPFHVQPAFVHEICRQVALRGGKTFITDSNTLYLANRHNAVDHMQTAATHGFHMAPFIVADGLKSENYHTLKTRGALSEIEVAGAIAEADAMIVVSHCKGHELSGFGGAIKNLGMGCTSASGKLRQHRAVGIEIDLDKCVGCGKCREACAFHIPEIIEGKAHNTSPLCMRCPVCIDACPVDAIRFTHKQELCRSLASAAYGVLQTFKPGKVSYVSFAKDISEGCDCLSGPGAIVQKDVGVFASDSAVSIDAAFLNAVDVAVFNRASEVDCMVQVTEAKKLGLEGELNPEVEVLS